jgi:outer membrane immunogenic protein
MKKFLLATVSMVALTSVARAADISDALKARAQIYSPGPTRMWEGAYFGVQGGVARRGASFNDGGAFAGDARTTQFDGSRTGATIGGLLGYNWQLGSFVYGVEGDWNWIGAKTTQVVPNFGLFGANLSTAFDVSWLASVRGRAGLALDSTLLYITGGPAFGRVENNAGITTPLTNTSFPQDQTKVGWTAGVGAEYMLSQHWTARAEFRYVDLGRNSVACTTTTRSCSIGRSAYRGEFSNTLKLGLVGLNYKF